jgi:hypothetical protein
VGITWNFFWHQVSSEDKPADILARKQALKNCVIAVSGGTDHLGWNKVKIYGPIPTLS